MNNLLTTRQVIEILKVDRITVYRMLQDGRLKGIKVGKQWRFPSEEVETFLSKGKEPFISQSSSTLPLHCLQTIQTLFSSISGASAILIDLEGQPLTTMSAPCKFCGLMMSNPDGANACHSSWKQFAALEVTDVRLQKCHAGLDCILVPIRDQGVLIATLLVGEGHFHNPVKDQMQKLAKDYSIPLAELMQAAKELPIVDGSQALQLRQWAGTAAQAMESILKERAGFIQRLQQIAQLSQMG